MLLVLAYMLIYNLTSLALFATLTQVLNTNLRTLLSLADLDASSPFTKALSLIILSLAGVPPLLGFFSKVFVFVLVTNANLPLTFLPLFILLFSGLYFYVQNLRFLSSSNGPDCMATFGPRLRMSFTYFTLVMPIIFLILFGAVYVDDLILFST